MKKKVRNNKVILASILALGCLTAASVGFSSWVIAAQDTSAASNVKSLLLMLKIIDLRSLHLPIQQSN